VQFTRSSHGCCGKGVVVRIADVEAGVVVLGEVVVERMADVVAVDVTSAAVAEVDEDAVDVGIADVEIGVVVLGGRVVERGADVVAVDVTAAAVVEDVNDAVAGERVADGVVDVTSETVAELVNDVVAGLADVTSAVIVEYKRAAGAGALPKNMSLGSKLSLLAKGSCRVLFKNLE